MPAKTLKDLLRRSYGNLVGDLLFLIELSVTPRKGCSAVVIACSHANFKGCSRGWEAYEIGERVTSPRL